MVLPSGALSSRTPGGSLTVIFSGRPGMLDAAADPVDVGALDAVIVFQERARPDIGGELIFGHADLAALEVFGLFHPVGADIDRGVAEGARHEGRHRDIGTIALRRLHRVARHRQFADVELGGAEGAEENLLRHELHVDRIDAVDLHRAVEQRAVAVVVADGDREIELGHGKSLPNATYVTVMLAPPWSPCRCRRSRRKRRCRSPHLGRELEIRIGGDRRFEIGAEHGVAVERAGEAY